MQLKDDDIRVLQQVDELAGTDDSTHVREINNYEKSLNADQIRYRLRRLEDQILVERWEAESPLRDGEFPPKLVRLTDEGEEVVEEAQDPEATLEERIDDYEEQLDLFAQTYAEAKHRVAETENGVERLEGRVDELENDVSELIGKVDRLIDHVEE